MSKVGSALKLTRLSLGLSLKEFGGLLGMSESMMCSIESGSRVLSEKARGETLKRLDLTSEEFHALGLIGRENWSNVVQELLATSTSVVVKAVVARMVARSRLGLEPAL